MYRYGLQKDVIRITAPAAVNFEFTAPEAVNILRKREFLVFFICKNFKLQLFLSEEHEGLGISNDIHAIYQIFEESGIMTHIT